MHWNPCFRFCFYEHCSKTFNVLIPHFQSTHTQEVEAIIETTGLQLMAWRIEIKETAVSGERSQAQILHLGSIFQDIYFFLLFKILFIQFQRKGKGERKRGRKTSMCGCLSHNPHWGLAHNPSICPDWESNWQPFDSQAGTPSTEPHQPSQYHLLSRNSNNILFT